MGLNTTVVILNDALEDIKNDPAFGANLVRAIQMQGVGEHHRRVSAGRFANGAYVVETHHSDFDVMVRVGGNKGERADDLEVINDNQ